MKKKEQISQLNLFSGPKTESDFIWEAISQLKDTQDRVRKKLFDEISDLKSSLIETKAQNERLMAIISDWKQLDIFVKRSC
jgi:hypothetical protein